MGVSPFISASLAITRALESIAELHCGVQGDGHQIREKPKVATRLPGYPAGDWDDQHDTFLKDPIHLFYIQRMDVWGSK